MPRYDQARFLTTHNSYSGKQRGSLLEQLSSGVRLIELDFHDNGWGPARKDYRVGHLTPGMEVQRDNGNPTTFELKEWLRTIAAWSSANRGHAPITIVLDSKGDLTDNDAGGDLTDFNTMLLDVFGPRLFTREEHDSLGNWPDVGQLAGRILCVLSGHGGTRAAYRWSYGSAPALGRNAAGDLVLLYESPVGDLKYWSGKAGGGTITWLRKGTYAPSELGLRQPSVAVTDGGWVVAACCFARRGFPERIARKVGRIQDDAGNEGRIKWYPSESIGSGIAPTLKIDGDVVTEVHLTSSGREEVRGQLDRQRKRIAWQKPRATRSKASASGAVKLQGTQFCCGVDPAGWIGCSYAAGLLQPARFRQLAFVELQKGEDPATLRDALFFAADAKNRAAIASARSRGLVCRAWGFEQGDETTPWVENMPATDSPSAPWYQAYMQGAAVAV